MTPAPGYALHGLTIRSELPLPGLSVSAEPSDVAVRFGEVPARLESCQTRGVLFEASPGQYLLHVDGVARYQVTGGKEILVDPAAGASEEDMRLFLLGSPCSALLHQRGALAMHAAAIRTPRGAVLLAGRSGVGKSTLLTALLDRGHEAFADDLVAVTLRPDGEPEAHAGAAMIKLWADALARLGRSADGLHRVRPRIEKFSLPLTSFSAPHSTGIAAVYVLESHNENVIRIEPLANSARFNAVVAQTRNLDVLHESGTSPGHFLIAAAVARSVPIIRLTRPRHLFLIDELADLVESDIAA